MNNEPEMDKQTLDTTIDYVIDQMHEHHAYSPEFTTMVENLTQLHKMKMNEKASRPSADAVISVVGNLAGIVAILGFEQTHVITSKALGFVSKIKI